MASTKSIRINFDDRELKDIEYLMAELNQSTIHKLIRTLIAQRADEKRENTRKYGKTDLTPETEKVPRETKEQRINRRADELRAMSDEDLTKALIECGVFAADETWQNGVVARYFIETNEAGQRVARYTALNERGQGDNSQMGAAETYILKGAKALALAEKS